METLKRLRLNPLHCGAVVASPVADAIGVITAVFVLIPFIAGQWSLQMDDDTIFVIGDGS